MGARPKLKLIVDKIEGGYTASIEEVTGQAFPARLERRIAISEEDRASLIASFSLIGQVYGIIRGEEGEKEPEEVVLHRLESSGRRLYTRILPPEVRDTLQSYEHADVVIDTNDVEIPFELFHDGENFLCLKHSMGRQVRSQMRLKPPRVTERGALKAAVICDPTGDLPEALREGKEIRKTLSEIGVVSRVELYSGGEVTKSRFEEVLAGRYGIIHYAGHVDYDEENPERSSFRLADGRLSAAEVRNILSGNPLVFVNACGSARTTAGLEGMAAAFIYGGGERDGVIGYVGNTWNVHDDAAYVLAKTFYRQLGSGETIGESLRRARIQVLKTFKRKDAGWAHFLLYGDPTMRLVTKLEGITGTYIRKAMRISRTIALLGGLMVAGGLAAVALGADYSPDSPAVTVGGVGILTSAFSLPATILFWYLNRRQIA